MLWSLTVFQSNILSPDLEDKTAEIIESMKINGEEMDENKESSLIETNFETAEDIEKIYELARESGKNYTLAKELEKHYLMECCIEDNYDMLKTKERNDENVTNIEMDHVNYGIPDDCPELDYLSRCAPQKYFRKRKKETKIYNICRIFSDAVAGCFLPLKNLSVCPSRRTNGTLTSS